MAFRSIELLYLIVLSYLVLVRELNKCLWMILKAPSHTGTDPALCDLKIAFHSR
jgi:hypothetical protein